MPDTCLVTDCDDTPCNSRGYCNKHYIRFMKYGDPLFTKQYKPGQLCEVEECNRPVKTKNMCGMHYQRMCKHGTVNTKIQKFRGTTEERFWHYAQKHESGCWIWTGPTTTSQRPNAKVLYYPILFVSETSDYVRAHRWGYERYIEPIPEKMQLDHVCRNTLCVNFERTDPLHLEVVTNRENTIRGEKSSLRLLGPYDTVDITRRGREQRT